MNYLKLWEPLGKVHEKPIFFKIKVHQHLVNVGVQLANSTLLDRLHLTFIFHWIKAKISFITLQQFLKLFQANGDGGSSTSESSLSSGYGSQNNVVRINPTSATSASASGSSSDPDMTNPQSSHNTQQLQNDGKWKNIVFFQMFNNTGNSKRLEPQIFELSWTEQSLESQTLLNYLSEPKSW